MAAVHTEAPSQCDLPPADSPTLTLVPGTSNQARECWAINGVSWKGPLSDEAYVRREEHLASQPLTAGGGVTYWVLVDSADPSPTPTILAACESYRKKAIVTRRDRPGEVDEITSHGIGSVFCRDAFRGKGYAGRMMEELAKVLRTWQQETGKEALFNVLYSDIGKKFYAKRGWVPFPSTHVGLPAVSEGEVQDLGLPATAEVRAEHLRELCEIDVAQLKRSMARFDDTEAKAKVAFLPEADLLGWQHSREEFVARELFQREPIIKGAIVGSEPGKRVWCIWNRIFSSKPEETTLYITRLVVEDSEHFITPMNGDHTNSTNIETGEGRHVNAIAACMRAAQLEATRWHIGKVELWNPAAATFEAVRKLNPNVELVKREHESIASLLWYGSEFTPDELEWVGNEKYGWC